MIYFNVIWAHSLKGPIRGGQLAVELLYLVEVPIPFLLASAFLMSMPAYRNAGWVASISFAIFLGLQPSLRQGFKHYADGAG